MRGSRHTQVIYTGSLEGLTFILGALSRPTQTNNVRRGLESRSDGRLGTRNHRGKPNGT